MIRPIGRRPGWTASRRIALPVIALVLAAAAFAARASTAAADATIETSPPQNGYPATIVFPVKATAPAAITDLSLVFGITGQSSTSAKSPDAADFTPGTSVTTKVSLDVGPNRPGWLPVGNELTYHWEAKLADGSTSSSKEEKYVYLPTGREWKSVSDDTSTVYYSGPSDTNAKRFLAAMADTLAKHGKQLLKTDVPRKPVKLILFTDPNDLRTAIPSKGTTLDNSQVVVTCGLRPGSVPDLIFAAVSCGGGDAVDTVRHEFGHVLNAAAGEGTLVKLPMWLDEGLAVYAQNRQDEYTAAFNAGRSRQALIPFAQMTSLISDQNKVILQYGEAFTMVKYLIDNFGADHLDSFLAMTKGNKRIDEALKAVYGFDLTGFEQQFVAAVTGRAPNPAGSASAAPRAVGSPTAAAPTARPAQAASPTAAPTAAPVAASTSKDRSIGTGTKIIFVVAILFALFAVLAFLASMLLSNSRKGSGGPPSGAEG